MVIISKYLNIDYMLIFIIFKASYFLSLFEFGGIFGSILSGVLSDYMYRLSIMKSQNEPNSSKQVNSTQIRMSIVRYFMIGLILIIVVIFNFIFLSKLFFPVKVSF